MKNAVGSFKSSIKGILDEVLDMGGSVRVCFGSGKYGIFHLFFYHTRMQSAGLLLFLPSFFPFFSFVLLNVLYTRVLLLHAFILLELTLLVLNN
jgi:hypothetical protein